MTWITPACAGNTTPILYSDFRSRDHPRLRGEYYNSQQPGDPFAGSPPLARGILCILFSLLPPDRITPACAGNTDTSNSSKVLDRDHPRLRGEYRNQLKKHHFLTGSPPLARGIPSTVILFPHFLRITPACAGNTEESTFISDWSEDHPRLRGEYCSFMKAMISCRGSPPLARGIR